MYMHVNNFVSRGIREIVPVVTPTDRPKSVRNRCVIEVFGCIFVCHVAFWISLWVWGLLS